MKKILYPLLVCGLFACSKKDTQTPQSTEPVAVTEVSAYLAGVDSLSEFETAFKKITIGTADASGGLTVFAPGNETIGSYDIGAKTMGKDLPDSIIKSHIVKGVFKAADLTDGKQLTTLSGKVFTVKVIDGKIYVNGVLITIRDGKAGTQVVHCIAKMLTTSPGGTDVTVYDATKWSENNRSGQLLAGATVNLYLTTTEYQNNTPSFTALTNNDGVAHFTGLPVATYFAVVKKDALSNIWPDANGNTYVSTDSLFQSQTEINNSNPGQYSAGVGDFRFADLNMDGIVNGNDKGIAPIRTIIVKEGEISAQKILIGYEKNSVRKLFTTLADAQLSLNNVITQVGVVHKSLVMLDGIMSDDADCTGLTDWCTYDQFTFTANANKTSDIWTSEFASITALNRIIQSLPKIGDTSVIAAQARAMRAYVYLELATYFGGLPVYNDLAMPVDISRKSLADTYAFIQNELLIAINTLPATADVHIVTKGAAKTLLARIALANSNFSAASNYAIEVIQSNYSLVDSTQIYASATSSEIVWDLSDTFPYDFSTYWSHGICPVARIAELHLIRAEADIAMGNLSSAGSSINLIRNRSGMPVMSMANLDDARTALRDTYQKEFFKAGFRFASLVRWGLAAQVLTSKGYQSYRSLLPIPMSVIQNDPNMVQNPGY
jgi:uncharacterized surface protein with fasciclin (FAS1) repeats